MNEKDPYNLKRFVDAQRGCYSRVVGELTKGRKTSHWVWFIFPQLTGLGKSATAKHYAIGDLDEARAYLTDPLLGRRLLECCDLLLRHEGKSIETIMGFPDNLKLRSSMTLFSQTTDSTPQFRSVLKAFFKDGPDPLTLDLLGIKG